MREYVQVADVETDGVASGVLGVGRPGKVGVLEATLGTDARSGVTGLKSRYVKAPMSLTRPLYVDPADQRHAVLYLRTTGGGLAENDRMRVAVEMEAGAQATVTTQAATNVHRMNRGLATQWTSFVVSDEARLEYLPGHTTMYGGSRFVQHTEFEVAPSAALIAGEVTLAGRLARGEEHQFEALSLTMRVTREKVPMLSDRTVIVGPGSGRDLMLWGEYPVWATLVVVPPVDHGAADKRQSVSDLCFHALEASVDVGESEALAGVSTMVNNVGAIVRVASRSPQQARRVMDVVHDAARQEIMGKSAFDLRRM